MSQGIGNTLDLDSLLADREYLASAISEKYEEWQPLRKTWLDEKLELRNYLFATDTRKTTNSKLPWKNSTTLPKLTQIRDNLHANYMAALFPSDDWLEWEGTTLNDQVVKKQDAIENYMKTKLRQDNAESVFSRLILDFIDYGNCFATAKWVDESVVLPNGETKRGYVGPRFVRISPYDIVFNPVATSFEQSPKIIRSVTTLGQIAKDASKLADGEAKSRLLQIINREKEVRTTIHGYRSTDTYKQHGLMKDGFGNLNQYFGSDYVEFLTFYGDMYDINKGHLYENYKIVVVDRMWVLSMEPNPDWTVGDGIFTAGWRLRPDNLYAMGPLDNLVGMQYRIDHLENLKSDAFDLIAFPIQKIRGFVEDYNYEPGARINVGEEGDVEFMRADLSAVVSADTQINTLMAYMEELAGAPREAMGFRTPGEKTKFEVQTLDNAASRVFQNKIQHFEREFLTKLLNYALSLSRQNMSAVDVVRTLDSEVEAFVFSNVTKEDITAAGVLRPVGASHFARKANILQNIVNLANTPLMNDPAVNVHISGKKMAQLLEELSDLDEFTLFSDNIRVFENAETQRQVNSATERVQQAAITPAEIGPSGL